MKYCLSSRQEAEYLKKADEIKFEYRDRKAIPDFAVKYPNATIILNYNSGVDGDLNWQELKNYNVLCKTNFLLCVDTISDCRLAKENGIKFYHAFAVHTPYELNAITTFDVSYIVIDAPLFFNLDVAKAAGVPIRVTPNLAQKDGLPRMDGVCGSWIRPEDIDAYAEYIDAIEFDDFTIDREKYYQKERALYRIYAEQKSWPGPLDFLITGLDYPGENRMISSEASRKRMFCGQKCQQTKTCKICYRMLDLADPDKMQEYKDTIASTN